MRSSLFILILAAAPAVAPAGELRVGSAAVKITPEVGSPMAGYFAHRKSEGVHDDLFAKAVVLEEGGTKAALVALDLLATTPAIVADARREIERISGLRGENVMISATHAHTGPVLTGQSPSRDELVGGNTELALAYRAALPGKIAEAVRLAEQALTPASLALGTGQESSIAFNRRFHMADGTVRTNPGKLNPKILKPAGPIDPEVSVVSFATAAPDRKPIALYVNYAVHLDNIGGTQLSADLPYTLSKAMAEVQGPDAQTLFTAGCCGDINHVNVNHAGAQKGFANAARMGTILAAEVMRTLPRLETIEQPGPLRVRRAPVQLALPEVTPEAVERAKADAAKVLAGEKLTGAYAIVDAYKVLDVAGRQGKPYEVEVQVIALGDEVAWVSMPGEIFVELGLAIKRDSPFKKTIIATLANGSNGYIPTRRAYAEGSYEVINCRCAPGSGEMLVDVATGLLRDLYLENARGKSAD